ncbi:hypothetical protein M2475_001589 [Breznakia sp. PF5-3]|uniref:hypothetical protein n=1 Tax=unclassified Breznakia TaxID=2623764 RepID=UPI0024075A00|nr:MULTISPECIES: hypothetical protein [unclassified Breznakia]MDL2276297.1 hypothetical protein [Breznakia sp. OttesenSCG-928-G09]MDF9825126.1 hypothetical protein [Breznakia sp. PM6-1]MDF9836015.1 hypothetical protein [Breznakia sp. PF5-3]MDF9838113.1 hypothetical protein [Breznakia sp. PFB2-8]MDF9860057.1 hypothetical protein [Breznakia sp. PH5-24]
MKKYLVYRTGDDKNGKMINVKLKNIKVSNQDGKWTLKNDGKTLMIYESFNEGEFFFSKILDFRTNDKIYLDLNEVKNYWNENKNKPR